ncbi:MAG: isopentenyl-diphosphate delta-isomerase [Legionellales bacterium]|nr:isopentenyl-diphosphate delta-isomerase [Legionellales bacterium]|tara:strand:+ start:108282 stop:108791 length:510 start_codon:yes stop_codon:yes gene_type:complete
MEQVILVDEQDQPIGLEEKQKAHELALLHRAFSVFLFREVDGERQVLLQQRAQDKYHCGGLWTNTCCSHPREGETVQAAATRRLREEMGITAQLQAKGHFIYQAQFDNGLTEHELDHVLVGEFNGPVVSNPTEVAATRWLGVVALQKDMLAQPNIYTPWLAQALELALA